MDIVSNVVKPVAVNEGNEAVNLFLKSIYHLDAILDKLDQMMKKFNSKQTENTKEEK